MTLIRTVDPAVRRIVAQASGSVTLRDIFAHIEEERRAGVLSYSELIDGRSAHPALTADDVRKLVAVLREFAGRYGLGRTAVVVDTDLAYGMLRMIEMMMEDAAAIRPFRSQRDAEAWLAES